MILADVAAVFVSEAVSGSDRRTSSHGLFLVSARNAGSCRESVDRVQTQPAEENRTCPVLAIYPCVGKRPVVRAGGADNFFFVGRLVSWQIRKHSCVVSISYFK